MKGYAKVTLGANPYPTELLLRGIGGRIYREMPKNMQKSVTSVRDLLQTFINLEVYSILCPAPGHLLNGAKIL